MTLSQRLEIALNRRYTAKVVRDADALAFFLSVSADAESNGEGQVFERTQAWLSKSGHEKLAKVVATHAADEVRHEKMMRADLAKIGRTAVDFPASLRIVDTLGVKAGNLWERPMDDPEDIAKAYLLLYAVERRATERFWFMVDALEGVQPEIAASFREIAKDERSHLHYCVAVSRAAMPDDARWTALRDEMIALEAAEYTENSRRFMWHQLDHSFPTMSAPEKLFWKGFRKLADLLGRVQEVLPVGGAADMPSGRISSRNAVAA